MTKLLGRFDVRVQIGLLALLAVYFMVWPVWRAGFPIEIAQNEGWNAYHADAAMGAAALYPPTDTLIVNNYPPLSFYVVGALAKVTGTGALAAAWACVAGAGAPNWNNRAPCQA